MSARPVPVPQTCDAMYVVLTAESIGSDDTLPLPHPALLRHHGTEESAIAAVAQREHQRVVGVSSPIERAAQMALDTRIEVLRLAEANDGVVLDLTVPRVLQLTADQVSLDTSTQWYVLDAAAVAEGILRTDGLVQFGLPEVEVRDIAAQQHAPAAAVIAGLAHRLIAEWPTHDPVGPAVVTLRDIAYGLGDTQAPTTPIERGLPLTVNYDPEHTALTVTFHEDPTAALFGS